jgi:hypothetical protein
MKILAIDPGIDTGICCLDSEEDSKILQTLKPFEIPNILVQTAILYDPDVIVIERLPAQFGIELREVLIMIRGIINKFQAISIEEIAPAQWKPVSKARKWNNLYGKTQHEKDAYCMARYYLWCHEGEK